LSFNEDFVFGEGLIEAVEIEGSTIYPRIEISKAVMDVINSWVLGDYEKAIAIEQRIKDALETNGKPCGNFHFRYIKVKPNEPWFSEDGEYHSEVGKALFSLSTMHTEAFPNEVETDWTTGKIIKL
jgi:hypothetical protein